jgi:hypothetical protein
MNARFKTLASADEIIWLYFHLILEKRAFIVIGNST